MKLLIFSDIHGSLPVAGKIRDLFERHAPEAVVILGDVLYHGPRNPQPTGYAPREAAETLSPLASRIIAVKGNCDSEVDAALLPFPLSEPFSWILHDSAGRPGRIFATHGHIFGPQTLPPLQADDILLFGHTHVPKAERNAQGIYICNPGSLSLPKEGHPPCYGIFDNGVFSVLTDTDETYLRIDCNPV